MTNKEQIKGKFETLKGEIKKKWGKLTDDDVILYEGNRERFLGKIQEKYGLKKETAEKKVKELEKACCS